MSVKSRASGIKRWVYYLLAILLLIIITVFLAGPELAEKKLNLVTHTSGYAVTAEAQKLHSTLLVADMHADSLLFNRDLNKKNNYGHVDVPRLIEGNVALQFFTVVTKSPRSQNIESNDGKSDNITALAVLQRWPAGTWRSLKNRALYQSEKLHNFAAKSNGKLVIIKTSKDLEKYLEMKKSNPAITAGILGLEGAHALEGDLANLDVLYDAGFRMIGPTHFFDNEVGGSAHGVEKGGLTPFGREVIKRMEQLNIIVDLAHASPAMIEDILDMSSRPVVVSHTGVKGTFNNNRNLTDEQIRRIASKGGLIGIGFWDTAVGSTDPKAISRSIRYVADLVGVKHVALGSDYDGTVKTAFDTSQMAVLTEALMAEGLSENDIRMVMGGNVIRLLKETLPY